MSEEPRIDRYEFAIAYDGRALADHTMDVQALGPALTAIGRLCQEANRVINGPDAAGMNVHVKATGAGCFDLLLVLQRVFDDAAALVRDDSVSALKEILEWLGLLADGVLDGLLPYLKWKGKRKVVKQEKEVNDEGSTVVNVIVDDGDNTAISDQVKKLAEDLRVRAALLEVLAPLKRQGVETFQVRRGTEPVLSVKKDERGYFDVDLDELDSEDPTSDSQTFTACLEIRVPSFAEGARWQFLFGGRRIWASLKDPDFVRRVFDGDERFGAGDIFRVHLRLAQDFSKNGGIRNHYEILKVIEIIPRPRS